MKTAMLKAKLVEVLATPTPAHEVEEKKYGWYPCSWETYRRLKLLNYLRFLALRQEAAKARWEAKLPHNRVIRRQGKVKLEKPIPIPEPKVYQYELDSRVENDYRLARYPAETREAVGKVSLSPARIDELLAAAAETVLGRMKEAV